MSKGMIKLFIYAKQIKVVKNANSSLSFSFHFIFIEGVSLFNKIKNNKNKFTNKWKEKINIFYEFQFIFKVQFFSNENN